MFATAQKDKDKQKMVAESVREALQHGQLTQAITGIINSRKTPPDGKGDTREKASASPPPPAKPEPPPPQPPATHADLMKSLEILRKALEPQLRTGKISAELSGRGLVISLREAAFFSSGDDAVSAA